MTKSSTVKKPENKKMTVKTANVKTINSAAKAETNTTKNTDAKASTKKDAKQAKPVAKPTIVGKGHLVSVEYVGTLDNGEEFDNSSKNGPIQFIVGASQVIKGFDEAVIGMKVNDKKKFRIIKTEAYGDINPALLHKVPLAKLPPEIKSQVKVGGFLVLQSPTGQQIPAKVKSIDKENVTLDLNHPLAGKDLTFDIKIVDIEIAPAGHMHNHDGECGCDDDGCNCDDDCKDGNCKN